MEVTLRASSHPEGRPSCVLPVGSISPKYDIVPLSLDGLIVVVDERFGGEPLVVVKSLGQLRDGFVLYLACLRTHLYWPSPSYGANLTDPRSIGVRCSLHATCAL